VIARLAAWFLGHFFTSLLVFACVAQWTTSWWLFAANITLPLWVHGAGVLAFYGLNHLLVRRGRFGQRGTPHSLGLRIYFAWALMSICGGGFLLAAALAYGAWSGIESVLVAQTTFGTAFPSINDDSFRTFTRVGLVAIGLIFVYGYTVGQTRLRTREFDIPTRSLPTALDGLRIAQISDVHMGQNLEPQKLRSYVERVNALSADLICVTGDLIDSPHADMERFLPIFAELRARYGVFAILGNHDHASGADRVADAFRRLTDIVLLRDAHVPVPIGASELHLIGLDDRGIDWARGLRHDPKLDDLFTHVPGGAPVVLLNHRPDLFEHAAALGIGLTLSGHTHGGQIAMPWITGRYLNPSRFITRYDRGLYEKAGCFLYTNCGLGVTSQRVRICTPREISVFRLRQA